MTRRPILTAAFPPGCKSRYQAVLSRECILLAAIDNDKRIFASGVNVDPAVEDGALSLMSGKFFSRTTRAVKGGARQLPYPDGRGGGRQ
jgi:hypothetical protein